MTENIINTPYNQQTPCLQANPNAVSINIFAPQAYGTSPNGSALNSVQSTSYQPAGSNFYSLYNPNTQQNLYYPNNYNNLIPQQNPYQNNGLSDNQISQNNQNGGLNANPNSQNGQNSTLKNNSSNPTNTTESPVNQGYYQNGYNNLNPQQNPNQNNGLNNNQNPQNESPSALNNNSNNNSNNSNQENITERTNSTNNQNNKTEKDEKTKEIAPLTDDYIKSLENYLNDSNPKVRMIAAKEIMERFKEDDNRQDNPSLVALLNKCLQDTSPSVRFLALTTLKVGYSVGDEKTVELLKKIQTTSEDDTGEDALLASEILLKLSAPKTIKQKVE